MRKTHGCQRLDLPKAGTEEKWVLLLQGQRKMLLNGIHKNQSCIEFLDDVLYGMRKEGT